MTKSTKKRGQKFIRRFSRARVNGKEHIRENLFARVSHARDARLLIFEWIFLVAILVVLAATQAVWYVESYAADVFVDGGTYTEATLGKVNSLNPLFATTNSEKVLGRLMFPTLTQVDYSGNTGLGLAQSLRTDDGGRSWRVRLREGLKWSDGTPITNEDVLFTVKLIQNPAVASVYDANLQNVNVSENEAGEIVFALPVAYADFASTLEIPIVPKHELDDAQLKTLIEDDFSNAPVGAGAFVFNASQSTSGGGETFYLTANPYYYGGKPMLGSFAVRTYDNEDGIIDAINAGTVTATAELSGDDLKRVKNESFATRETSLSTGAFIFFNTTNGAFRNGDLRRAVRQGINISALRAEAPNTTVLDYPLTASQINLSYYPEIPARDVEAARSTVASVNDGGVLHVNIATVSSGCLPAVAEVLKSELGAIGIDAELTVYPETQEFVANVIGRRSYDILVYELELGADPDPLPYYHSSQASSGGLNLSNYRNALADDLLIGARETMDKELRARKYETFLDYWVTDVPAIGLYLANLTYIYNKNVRPYNDNIKLVTALDRFMDVGDWAVNVGLKNLTP